MTIGVAKQGALPQVVYWRLWGLLGLLHLLLHHLRDTQPSQPHNAVGLLSGSQSRRSCTFTMSLLDGGIQIPGQRHPHQPLKTAGQAAAAAASSHLLELLLHLLELGRVAEVVLQQQRPHVLYRVARPPAPRLIPMTAPSMLGWSTRYFHPRAHAVCLTVLWARNILGVLAQQHRVTRCLCSWRADTLS